MPGRIEKAAFITAEVLHVNLVQACLCARKHRESSFHHCGSSVKFMQACLSCRNRRESSFHHCGISVKLLQDCLSA